MKTIIAFLFLSFFTLVNPTFAQFETLHALWDNPAVQEQIRIDIEANRKGLCRLVLTDTEGNLLKNVSVEVVQQSHEFLFGANSFYLKGYDNEKMNKQWEESYAKLFNFTTVPFYWKAVEPEQGKFRFEKKSPKIERRPPADLVLEFCRKYKIKPKGHPLFWDYKMWNIPDWMPLDDQGQRKAIATYIDTVAARYGNAIDYWDVANEVTANYEPYNGWLPHGHIEYAFKVAEKALPTNKKFILNETLVWERFRYEYSPFYMFIENLQLKGVKLDGIGIQSHFFTKKEVENIVNGKSMTPAHIKNVLDAYAKLHLPIHISEITIPAAFYEDKGEALQAYLTKQLYRSWFSHPSVTSITWWNIADGTAAKGEDKIKSGLLDVDLKPKPSYRVLDSLINNEWHTKLTLQTNEQGEISFRGFYGGYTVKTVGGKENTYLQLMKDKTNVYKLVLK